MGDKKLSLFELHFDGPLKIGPSFGSDPEPDYGSLPQSALDFDLDDDLDDDLGADSFSESDSEAEDDGPPVKGAILGVVAIVALAVAARVLMGGGDDGDGEEPELVDLEDVSAGDDAGDDADTQNEDGA